MKIMNSLLRCEDSNSNSSMTDVSEEGDSCSFNNGKDYYYYSRVETKSFEFFCQIAYHKDWANDEKRDYLLSQTTNFTFPQKLYLLLTYNHTDSVTWCDDGRSFRILDKDRFMSDVVPRFYNRKFFISLFSLKLLTSFFVFACRKRFSEFYTSIKCLWLCSCSL